MSVVAMCVTCVAGAPDSASRKFIFPLADVPFSAQTERLSIMTMRQATDISASLLQCTYPYVAGDIWDRLAGGNIARLAAITGYTALAFNAPLSQSWRPGQMQPGPKNSSVNVLFNKSGPFDLFGGPLMMNQYSDSELTQLKRRHPADVIRAHTIGYELGNALNSRLLEDAFFYGTDPVYPVLWLSSLYATGLVFYSARVTADSAIEKNNRFLAQAAGIGFTGLDFTSWVYDLERPDDPYYQRANTGRSIDIARGVPGSALSGAEKEFLNLQGFLSFLNWIDPQWFTLEPLRVLFGNKEIHFDPKFAHNVTPFGYSLEGKVLCRSPDLRMFGTLRIYRSRNLTLPGFETGLVDWPLRIFKKDCSISPRMSSWLQPKNQRFDAQKSVPGAQAALRLNVPVGENVQCWSEADAKSTGWVAGNDYLDASLNFRLGIQMLFK